jgi:Tfp pilus assembly protein PilF
MADLDKALELVPTGKGRIACQAHIQRAMIHQLKGEEESAREDYGKAAEMGSKLAKSQLVALNPYAAMCNQMLGEVMGRLQQRQE